MNYILYQNSKFTVVVNHSLIDSNISLVYTITVTKRNPKTTKNPSQRRKDNIMEGETTLLGYGDMTNRSRLLLIMGNINCLRWMLSKIHFLDLLILTPWMPNFDFKNAKKSSLYPNVNSGKGLLHFIQVQL